MNSNKLFWGLLLLAVGILWLLGNLGVISGDFWIEIWRLWPLLLVLWGISLLIGKDSKFGLVFSALSVVIVLLAILGFGWLYNNQKILTGDSNSTSISEPLEAGTTSGDLNLKFGAAKMNISSGTDKFVEGSADTFSGVDISRSTSGATQKVEIDQVSNKPVFWGGRGRNTIDLKLNESIPYDLNLDTGASQFDLDLSKLKITAFTINGGATSGEVKLSNLTNECDVEIASGASSFTLKVPQNSALKIDNKAGLSSNNFKNLNLEQDGNVWQTAGYNGAEKRIKITFSAGASSINIERY